jgi:endonuclease YncB( thermonuclease family)
MKHKKEISILTFLIILLIIINYAFFDSFLVKNLSNEKTIEVERVIDGDTVVVNGTSVRLLGINTPEKGEKYYSEAKNFTSSLVSNKTIKVETKGKDRYSRDLGYLFYNSENINLKIVREGYANYYFPQGKDKYYDKFSEAWEECLDENKNLCKKSSDKCSDCIELKEFDFKSQKLVFYNKCNFDCSFNNWIIKDEGRKNFLFGNFILESKKSFSVLVGDKTDTKEVLYWKGQTYVWTSTGDTMFLRDSDNKLVLWRSQGY